MIFMFGLFAATIWQRNVIRAHWWVWNLQRTSVPAEQGYYLSCLSSIGNDAVGAVNRMAFSPDAQTRLLAIFPLQRLTDPTHLSILGHLLSDDDADVREAAGLAIAFSSDQLAPTILCSATQDKDARIAANAAAACGRSEHAASCLYYASIHPQPLVRAQAVESLSELIASDGEGLEWTIKVKGPLETLIHALADHGSFDGPLALERESERAGGFLQTKGLNASQPSRQHRTVAEVAASSLSGLTGTSITTRATMSDEESQRIATRLRTALQKNRQPAVGTNMPALNEAIKSIKPQP
jgi:hypothetical protein